MGYNEWVAAKPGPEQAISYNERVAAKSSPEQAVMSRWQQRPAQNKL